MDSKKVDKMIILSSIFLIVGLGFIIYCINYVGSLSQTQQILFYIGTIFTAFFSGYLIFSVILWIFQLLFKKSSENFKVNSFLKSFIWIIISVVIFLLIRGYFSENHFNSPTNLIKLKIIPNALNNPSKEYCSNSIIFDKSTYKISSSYIKENKKINTKQIIFINPQKIDTFEITSEKLKNKNLFPKSYIICSICDTKENTSVLLNNYEITDITIDSTLEGETFCLVYPKK